MKKILIVNERKLMCDYWRRVLQEANYQVNTCYTTAQDVLAQTHADAPDFLLIESSFSNGNGFETARQAIAKQHTLKCIMMMPIDMQYFSTAIQINISGYVPIDLDDPIELLTCLHQITQGYRYVSQTFWNVVGIPSDKHIQMVNQLSQRRKQVLRLLAKGYTAKQIAIEMAIAEATVRNHKDEISRIIGLDGVHQLKVFAGSVAHLLN